MTILVVKKPFKLILSEHWKETMTSSGLSFDEHKTIAENLKFFAKILLKFLYQQETINLFKVLIWENNHFPDLVDEIVIGEKAPFTRTLSEYLQCKKKNSELEIANPSRSATYFTGLLKEYHFWPMMLGFTRIKKLTLTEQNTLIDEAINIFLKAYKK